MLFHNRHSRRHMQLPARRLTVKAACTPSSKAIGCRAGPCCAAQPSGGSHTNRALRVLKLQSPTAVHPMHCTKFNPAASDAVTSAHSKQTPTHLYLTHQCPVGEPELPATACITKKPARTTPQHVCVCVRWSKPLSHTTPPKQTTCDPTACHVTCLPTGRATQMNWTEPNTPAPHTPIHVKGSVRYQQQRKATAAGGFGTKRVLLGTQADSCAHAHRCSPLHVGCMLCGATTLAVQHTETTLSQTPTFYLAQYNTAQKPNLAHRANTGPTDPAQVQPALTEAPAAAAAAAAAGDIAAGCGGIEPGNSCCCW